MPSKEEYYSNILFIELVCFLDGSALKNLLAILETRVRSLGQEGSLEKEMAFHSIIPAWKTPWTEESHEL